MPKIFHASAANVDLWLCFKAGMLQFKPVGQGNIVGIHPGYIAPACPAQSHVAGRGPPPVGWQTFCTHAAVAR